MTDEQIIQEYQAFVNSVNSGGRGEIAQGRFGDILDIINRQKKSMNKIKNDLKYYFDINEENGVVYIPSFAIKNLIDEVTEK